MLRDSDGRLVTVRAATSFTWASSNSAVAAVDRSGLVSGGSPGTATITLTVEGLSATARVTVTPSAPSPSVAPPSPAPSPPPPSPAPPPPPTAQATLTGRWVGNADLSTSITGATCTYSGSITLNLTQAPGGRSLSGSVTYNLTGSAANSRVRCPVQSISETSPINFGTVSGGTIFLAFNISGFSASVDDGRETSPGVLEGTVTGEVSGSFRVSRR